MADGVFMMGLLDAHSRIPITHLPSLHSRQKDPDAHASLFRDQSPNIPSLTLVAQTEDLEYEN